MLNLTRRLRSLTFDQLIGQPLVIRILKNSLYKNYFFPLYLFSGMRGCGKTSTARIFAMAINCERLIDFQKNPRENIIPCLICHSCLAAKNGVHPDINEIDAASNTGVDNIRLIIENSTYLPVMGKKKIYIIDEAHMLSKSAFNAFLKVLEEPSESVLFILATTEQSKIIDTVISRSLQLFFRPVSQSIIKKYLLDVCKEEEISIEEEGLEIIAVQSEGSVRDALNMVEQVRFIASFITKEHVQATFGQVSNLEINNFIKLLLEKKIAEISHFFKNDIWQRTIPESFFKQLLLFIRPLALKSTNQKNYIKLLYHLCKNEFLFLKATEQKICFEAIIFEFLSLENHNQPDLEKLPEEIISKSLQEQPRLNNNNNNNNWLKLIKSMEDKIDPLVVSFFAQAEVDRQDEQTILNLPKKFAFFEEMINKSKDKWEVYLKEYGKLIFKYTLEAEIINEYTKLDQRIINQKQPNQTIVEPQGALSKRLTDLFPGVVTINKSEK